MRFSIPTHALAAAALAAITAAGAQTSAPSPQHLVTIAGRIVDAQTGAPLANVGIFNEAREVVARTDNSGHFRVDGLAPGKQKLTASLNGYTQYYRYARVPSLRPCAASQKSTRHAKACGHYTVMVNFSLVPGKTTILAAAPVAPRREAPPPRAEAAEPVSMPDSTIQPQGWGRGARGRVRGLNGFNFGGNRPGMMMLDGQAVDPSTLNNLAPNQIQSIEVMKGEQAASRFGSGAGNGIVIIKTKR